MSIKPCENKTSVNMTECETCQDFEICYKWDLEILKSERSENEAS